MRAWTRVWIAIAAVCVWLTVYEIPDAVRIGRFTWGMMRGDRYTGGGELNIPAVVTDKLVAADPEAGDMLRYCISENADMEELAALAARYPQNEFLLSELAEALTVAGVVDPQAPLVLVDRLQELSGDNAHHRYLRGWILLRDPNRSAPEKEALEQFESGHRLPRFYLPYSKYKERLDLLSEKAALTWERPDIRSFYLDLARDVFRSRGPDKRRNDDIFSDLSASIVRIAGRVIENAYDFNTLARGAALLGTGEGVRLRELDLSEAEAQQARLRQAQGLALMEMHRQWFLPDTTPFFNIVWMLWLPPVLLVTIMSLLLVIVLEFSQARLFRRKPKVCTSMKACMLIDAVMVAVLVLLVLVTFAKKRPEGELPGFLVFMAAIFILWDALGLYDIRAVNLVRLRRPRLFVTVLCVSLWFKGTVLWTAGRLSVSAPDNLTGRLQYGAILLGWSVFCLLVWAEAAYRLDEFAAKHHHGVILITYWAVVLMVVHIFGLVYAQMNRLSADPLSRYRPLPGATQESYNRVILGEGLVVSQPGSGHNAGIPGHLEYAAPKDMEAFFAGRRAAGRPIPEQRLQRLLRRCNRDLRSIILNELAEPNAYEVLVTRAEWGDRSVKEPLVRIFEERLAAYARAEPEPPRRGLSSLGPLLQLAGTLARVSDNPEGRERFSYLLEQVVEKTRNLGTGRMLYDPRHAERVMQPFWESLGKLPATQAATLIKSYLRQTRFVDLFGDRGRDIVQFAAQLADGDGELAEDVVGALAGLPAAAQSPGGPVTVRQRQRGMRLARYREKNSPQCLEAVFAHLSAKSIPLLLEQLDSDNGQLRAFIVWRVAGLGYEWPDEQLAELQEDSYWKVRLNVLFACEADNLVMSIDDENAVVRLVAQMLIEAQQQ